MTMLGFLSSACAENANAQALSAKRASVAHGGTVLYKFALQINKI
jgi:hypothetical protein